MNLFSGKKLLLVGFIIVLLVAIPLTVYLAQKQQQTQSSAAPSTTLSFTPAETTTSVGQTVSMDININPGSNQVSFLKLVISYDPLKLGEPSLVPNTFDFPSVLEGPSSAAGTSSVTLSVGADPTKVIQTATRAATLTFKALAATAGTPTKVSFTSETQALSIASSDQANENVLLPNAGQASITIGQGTTVTPPPAGTGTPVPTVAQTNQAPVCTALTIDRAATGDAPYSVTFGVTGNDPDGIINKITFNFGDTQVVDATQASGIGTNSVSAQMAHTYSNPGTFTASVLLTDNKGALSSSATCSKTITVTAAQGATGSAVTATPVPPPAEPTGPGNKIIGIGIAGAVISFLGALLFFAL